MIWLRKLLPGPLLSEALKVVGSLLIGTLLVTMLIFAPQSFLGRFGRGAGIEVYTQAVGGYLGHLLQGDLAGGARSGRVGPELIKAAQRSAQLIAFSLIVAVPLGLIWGGLLAAAQPRWLAGALFSLNILILALPSFVILILAIETVVDINRLIGRRLFYTNGYGLDSHILLPGGILALRGAAFFARIVHAAHDEVLRQDWLRAARAKGLGGLRLWRGHVLPALRGPLAGGIAGMLRVLVGGLVIVEYVYNWNGLGDRMLSVGQFSTTRAADVPIAAGAGILLVVFFVFADLLARLAQRWSSPHLRRESYNG